MKNKIIWRCIGFIVTVMLLIAFVWWNNCALSIERVSIQAPIDQKIRLVQLSDLHGAWFGRNQVRLVEYVRKEKPDFIALTGDFIDSRHDERAAVVLIEELANIAPVYFVTGNHEFIEMQSDTEVYERWMEALERTENVYILRGDTVSIAEGVTLTGAEDVRFVGGLADYPVYIEKLGEQTDAEFQILLAHRPAFFESYAQAGFNLTLTGHVHGGQFRIPFMGGVFTPDEGFFPEYDEGLYIYENGAKMYINRGLGNSAFPLRLFNRPQISMIELVPTAE